MEASLIGYRKVRQQDAKVVVGYTAAVDFRLEETTLEAAEIVVTAETEGIAVAIAEVAEVAGGVVTSATASRWWWITRTSPR